jgi:hypothetical protein
METPDQVKWKYYIALAIARAVPSGKATVDALFTRQPLRPYDVEMSKHYDAVLLEWHAVYDEAWATFPRTWQPYKQLMKDIICMKTDPLQCVRRDNWRLYPCVLFHAKAGHPGLLLYLSAASAVCWNYIAYWNSIPLRIEMMVDHHIKTQGYPTIAMVNQWVAEITNQIYPEIQLLKVILVHIHKWL